MEPMQDFAQLQLQFVDQIQWGYELIRLLVLLLRGTAAQRAADTHTHPDTVRTFTRRFHQQGMLGLLPRSLEVVPRRSLRRCGRSLPASKAYTRAFITA